MRILVRKVGARPLRVLHAIGQLGAGGLERQLFGLLGALDRDRIVSSVVTFAPGGGFFEPMASLGLPLAVLPARGLDRVRRLAELLRDHRADLIYAWGASAMVYGRLAAGLARVRAVTHDGSTAALPLPRRVRIANVALVPVTAAWVANSHRRAEELGRALPVHRSRIAVVDNGVEALERADAEHAARLRTELGLPDGPIVGCVGRLDRFKNQQAILEAARRLADGGRAVSVVLVGDGPDRAALMAQAAALGLADRVRLVGEKIAIEPILRGFSAFAFPSTLEGMPNAVQEALAAGVPVVASDVGDVRRLLDDGACGVVVPAGDVVALTDGLRSVLSEPERAAQRAETGRGRMRERFSMEHTARVTAALLERVARSSPLPFIPLVGEGEGV